MNKFFIAALVAAPMAISGAPAHAFVGGIIDDIVGGGGDNTSQTRSQAIVDSDPTAVNDVDIDTDFDNRNKNKNIQGQQQGQSLENENDLSNRNRQRQSTNNRQRQSTRSRANNNGNSQTVNFNQAPDAAIAPAPNPTAPGRVGDVVVPLPTVGVSAFGSRDTSVFGDDSQRSTYGAQFGFSIPLGTGQTRRAAEQVIARRDAEMRFQLIQEATYMLQAGVLSEEVHPEHWAALYGTPIETVSFDGE